MEDKKKEIVRRENFNVRFLELQEPFYDYIEQKDLTPSTAIRHFIKQGISETGGISIDYQNQLLSELIQLKKSHAGIGRNLNQIARYFNIHGHLIESDLRKNLEIIGNNQKDITDLFNKIFKALE